MSITRGVGSTRRGIGIDARVDQPAQADALAGAGGKRRDVEPHPEAAPIARVQRGEPLDDDAVSRSEQFPHQLRPIVDEERREVPAQRAARRQVQEARGVRAQLHDLADGVGHHPYGIRRRRRGGPQHELGDRLDQSLRLDGLQQVRVRARAEGVAPGLRRTIDGRHHDDRQRGMELLDRLADGQAVPVGQPHVQQHQRRVGRPFQRGRRSADLVHAEAGPLQDAGPDEARRRVVLDVQDAFIAVWRHRQVRPNSYRTTRRRMARPAGFEPATFGSGGQRSIQLSYGRVGTGEVRRAGRSRAPWRS